MSSEQLLDALTIPFIFGALILPIFLLLAYMIFKTGKKEEKKAKLRDRLKREEFAKRKADLERRDRFEKIGRLIGHTNPRSDEESRLIALAEAMNPTFEEWKRLGEVAAWSEDYCRSGYQPNTRSHIHYRQLRALESNAG